jgi:hypothetical protein
MSFQLLTFIHGVGRDETSILNVCGRTRWCGRERGVMVL